MTAPSFNSGGGAVITFAQLGTFYFRRFDNLRAVAPQVDGSHLRTGIDGDERNVSTGIWGTGRPINTRAREYILPDVADLQPIPCELLFNSFTLLPAHLVLDTITITYPRGRDEDVPAFQTGPGWYSNAGAPPFELNRELLAPCEFQFQYLGPASAATPNPAET